MVYTKDAYGENLGNNLEDLLKRMKGKRYRHQPIRRVYIPKADGKKRPIGVSSLKTNLSKILCVRWLEAIYEQDFLDCSYGFRPGRSGT